MDSADPFPEDSTGTVATAAAVEVDPADALETDPVDICAVRV